MMRSVFATFVLIGFFALLIVSMDIQEGRISSIARNASHEPIEMDTEHYACAECASAIKSAEYGAQVITPSGKTYFFDDIGCLCLWLNHQAQKETMQVWVYTQDTKRYILAKDAWFSRLENSPIGYGFGAYEIRVYARADYYFDEIMRFAIHGETRINPIVNKLLIENKY